MPARALMGLLHRLRSPSVFPTGMSATRRSSRTAERLAAAAVRAGSSAEAPNASTAAATAVAAAAPAKGRKGGTSSGAACQQAGQEMRQMEQELWDQGHKLVAGVDEAGRGPLAGPVVAAACVVPPHVDIPGIDDSKKLSEQQREAIFEQLTSHPDVLWAARVVGVDEIDSLNILQATMKAMEGAAAGLSTPPDFVLVDGNRLPTSFDPARARAVVKGDSRCLCIAAASVIAKVTRDRLMLQLHERWPDYNFAGHKGYGVAEHCEAIRRLGPCPAHRRSFNPARSWFPDWAAARPGSQDKGTAAAGEQAAWAAGAQAAAEAAGGEEGPAAAQEPATAAGEDGSRAGAGKATQKSRASKRRRAATNP